MRALVIGVTGQDGSYLAEQLTEAGDTVYGMIRGQANPKRKWIEKLIPSMTLLAGDLLDQSSLQDVIRESNPDVIYNLGAVTYVGISWQQPAVMSEVTGLGCMRVLEAIRAVNKDIRFVQASTSEMFGDVESSPQNEQTRFQPVSPYGVAKTFAHHTTLTYRHSYGMHASTAIMFNHESPRRGEEFVTRKVTLAAARIANGLQDELILGRLDPIRDWGWAPDYMRALPLIARQDKPDDYVLATGKTHSVSELCETAFAAAGMDWTDHVRSKAELYRPSEVWTLCGNAAKAKRQLGWRPKVSFDELVRNMVESDMRSCV